MKKLVLLFAAALLVAFSSNVFAQGSGKAPQIGSNHQYWVNGDFGAPSGHATSTYTWWVSTNAGDLTIAAPETDFTVVTASGGAAYNTAGESANGMELIWKPAAAGKTYYLVVEENDGTCTNIKAEIIVPVNAFDVTFAAIDASNANADNPSRCAPDIALTSDGTTITYNYGSDEYLYKINSAGLYSEWTFNFGFTNSVGSATPTIEYSTDGTNFTTEAATSGSKTVTPSSGSATVYFRVSLDNSTAEEGLSGQTMALTLTNISDGTNAPAHVYQADGTTEFTGAVEQTQTVNARPSTSGISSN